MQFITAGHKMAKEICDALGLENVKGIDLRMRHDERFTVRVEFYPDEDKTKTVVEVIKNYNLSVRE